MIRVGIVAYTVRGFEDLGLKPDFEVLITACSSLRKGGIHSSQCMNVIVLLKQAIRQVFRQENISPLLLEF